MIFLCFHWLKQVLCSSATIKKSSMLENNSEEIKRKKRRGSKKRKHKLCITFDENARREFLTGFHKRKLQRKAKAKEEFEQQLKAERKRIKTEVKEQYKKLLLSQKPIPELSDILSEDIDMGTHSVSVTELSPAVLAKKNNWIGVNEVKYERKDEQEVKKIGKKAKQKENLEGMELKRNNNKLVVDDKPASSCKEIKKKIKHQAAIKMKNSAVFKKNAQLERIKRIKLKKKQEKKLQKMKRKNSKH